MAQPTNTEQTGRVAVVTKLLTDSQFDRTTNLTRLQGWRGDDLDSSVKTATIAHRLAPMACGFLSLAVVATGSAALLYFTLATAAIGVFAPNHPFETIYNAIARRRDAQTMPPNRAAKRTGCAVGSIFLAGAAITEATGHGTIANGLLLSLGSLALFVAATGICVPSMMFTLAFGPDRASRRNLIG